MLETAFSPFPTMFSTLSKMNLNFSAKSVLSAANALNFDQPIILSKAGVGNYQNIFLTQLSVFLGFNPFPNKPWFLRVCITISPFATVFSTCTENFRLFSSNLNLSSVNPYDLEESKICCLGNG